mmetsp:Transcript_14936/g.42211  ORF Transcript_14936/g.42211 Transcript_14936/m.42211 type:complete len:253 (+) Transcript_14936:486-1244(+)
MRIALWMFHALVVEFAKSSAGQRVARSSRIEVVVAPVSLEAASHKVRFFVVVTERGQVGTQILRDYVQIFSADEEVIEVLHVVLTNEAPHGTDLLPHVVIILRPFVGDGDGGNSWIRRRGKCQEAIASSSPRFAYGADVGRVIFCHRVDHAQDLGSFGSAVRHHWLGNHSRRFQRFSVVIIRTAKVPNWLAKFSAQLWRPWVAVSILAFHHHPSQHGDIRNPIRMRRRHLAHIRRLVATGAARMVFLEARSP